MFGGKKYRNENIGQAKVEKLPGPKEIPMEVGSYMVVEMKQNPDRVWQLKGVVLPTNDKKTFYCRIFDESKVKEAGVKVRDWTSLDAYPDLILWEGFSDKETHTVRPEKYGTR